ncbi:AraC family transcriptional regulator [Alkalihalobacillus trypoxylicola]|uniref:HTH araC/xylS-type domain-containing protein n=1 Tax=Alkalihalobacillus trypoxylicola TaxID=519424 RepID=A0A161P7S1_9BACI|nr:AraC family transcriptional regulator [Alkalihalobacillus trypoxylicola]KYG28128.1 hypothetical protein AZF04_09500 [Alkalihalobacillus trypoxylicola]
MERKLNVSLREKSFYMNYNSESSPMNEMKHFHLHDDYEIFYLIEGERTYLINDDHYIVHENSLVFIDKNTVHKTRVSDAPNLKRIVLNFHDSFLTKNEEMLLKLLFYNGPHVLSIPSNKTNSFSYIFGKLLDEYQSNHDDSIAYIRHLLIQLLIESNRLLKQHNSQQNIYTKDQYFIKHEVAEMIGYINQFYYEDISLSLLSVRFNLNEQYISRIFRKVIGVTFINYLNTVRVNQAQRLLLETDMKVVDVSKRVGYSNNVHLWRVFKKQTGYSPNEFRELNQLI